MTIFKCEVCIPDRPCYFDNNSNEDDVRPEKCPIENYQYGDWRECDGSVFTEGICEDGAAILKDGVPMRITEILRVLNGKGE